MNPVCHCLLIRPAAGALVGLAALLASITTAPAALASPLRPDPPGWFKRLPGPGHLPLVPPGPAQIHAALAGRMPGWQITLIAAGASVFAAVLAVLASRIRAARRRATATTG